MDIRTAAKNLTDFLIGLDLDGVHEAVNVHEEDNLLVRLSNGSPIDAHVPSRYEGYPVRKSYYQTAYSPGFPSGTTPNAPQGYLGSVTGLNNDPDPVGGAQPIGGYSDVQFGRKGQPVARLGGRGCGTPPPPPTCVPPGHGHPVGGYGAPGGLDLGRRPG